MGNAVRQLRIRISIRVVSGYRGNRSPGYGLFPNGSVVKWKGKPKLERARYVLGSLNEKQNVELSILKLL